MVGKRVQFDEATWAAVDLLARDSMRNFQELADEAFRDLLAKHGRRVGLKDQLKGSLKETARTSEYVAPPPATRRKKTTARLV